MSSPSERAMEARKKAAEIVKRCGIRDGLFKGPRTLNAVETIAYEIEAAVEAERERCAKIAEAHKGSASRTRQLKHGKLSSFPSHAAEEIQAEERGEDIAAEIIARAIRNPTTQDANTPKAEQNQTVPDQGSIRPSPDSASSSPERQAHFNTFETGWNEGFQEAQRPDQFPQQNRCEVIYRELFPTSERQDVCVICGHDDGVDREGVCKYRRTKMYGECGCECVFPSTPPATATQSFYVVSDTWMGRALHVCATREEAAHNQYLETLTQHGYNEDSDQSEVRPEQFRAWPAETFPHELSFEEAFEWIGKQTSATGGGGLLPASEMIDRELVELALESHARAVMYPESKIQHDRANECRDELLRRLTRASRTPQDANTDEQLTQDAEWVYGQTRTASRDLAIARIKERLITIARYRATPLPEDDQESGETNEPG